MSDDLKSMKTGARMPDHDQLLRGDSLRPLASIFPPDVAKHIPEDTHARFQKFIREATAGYQEKAEDHLRVFDVASGRPGSFGPVIVRDITFSSLCEHHLAPFHGTCDIAYQPAAGRVLGLSKFARVLDVFAKRLQVQERLGVQVVDAIYSSALAPVWVAAKMDAVHTCMVCRGVRRPGAHTETISIAGPVPQPLPF